MARNEEQSPGLDAPKGLRSNVARARQRRESDRFGRFTEWIARAMGTPWFLFGLTVFCIVWLAWNSLLPMALRFDSQTYGFTVLTLVLSLQASYAAPLILLAQNRQDDRDRVQIEQDRQRAERNLADTEYLAREVVALRLLVRELASKDFIRAELKSLLEDLEQRDEERTGEAAADVTEELATGTTPAARATATAPAPGAASPRGRAGD